MMRLSRTGSPAANSLQVEERGEKRAARRSLADAPREQVGDAAADGGVRIERGIEDAPGLVELQRVLPRSVNSLGTCRPWSAGRARHLQQRPRRR
jgi:hypothetical protein